MIIVHSNNKVFKLIFLWVTALMSFYISAEDGHNSRFKISTDEITIAEQSFRGVAAIAVGNDDLPYQNMSVQVAPSIIVMGQIGKVFIEGNRAGYLLHRNEYGAFSAIGQIRSHQYLEQEAQTGIEREKALEAGVQWAKPVGAGWVSQVTLFQDISDTHQGQELEVSFYRRDHFGDFRLLSLFALQQQSQDLTGYYADTLDYKSDGDLNAEVEFIGVYEVTDKINVLAVYRHYLHGSGLSDSPLTDDDETKRLILGVGLSF